MDRNLLGSVVFYGILTFYCCLLLVPFVMRMDREPIRSRSPSAGIVGAVAVNLVALLQVLRAAGAPIPCGFTDIMYQIIWSVAMASYFYRVVALLHSYERHLRIAERARKQTDKLESKQKKATEAARREILQPVSLEGYGLLCRLQINFPPASDYHGVA
mmetsp:Transcript_26260/g.63280  ORF Transcript_26260/g.63280 Transcript_26260/m.63280 type:complete len:159 (-) Transcript_26260:1345-1821(-)